MSFFVSDSLKSLISEEDLEATGPIVFVDQEETLKIKFRSEDETFECLLSEINFCNEIKKVVVLLDRKSLPVILRHCNKKVTHCIKLGDNDYMHDSGIFTIDSLQVNSDDKNILCKIVIYKKELPNV